jgi:hypothetical protein
MLNLSWTLNLGQYLIPCLKPTYSDKFKLIQTSIFIPKLVKWRAQIFYFIDPFCFSKPGSVLIYILIFSWKLSSPI